MKGNLFVPFGGIMGAVIAVLLVTILLFALSLTVGILIGSVLIGLAIYLIYLNPQNYSLPIFMILVGVLLIWNPFSFGVFNLAITG